MIKVSNITRSKLLIEKLNEAGTDYAYLDDPDNRWIINAGPHRQGLGYLQIFLTDRCNVTEEYGHALFGHQDTVRNIINRSRSHITYLDESLDLTAFVSDC